MTTLYDHRRWHTQFRFRGADATHRKKKKKKQSPRHRRTTSHWSENGGPITIGTYYTNLYIGLSSPGYLFFFSFCIVLLLLLLSFLVETTPFSRYYSCLAPCPKSCSLKKHAQQKKVQRIKEQLRLQREEKKGRQKFLLFTIPDHVHTLTVTSSSLARDNSKCYTLEV